MIDSKHTFWWNWRTKQFESAPRGFVPTSEDIRIGNLKHIAAFGLDQWTPPTRHTWKNTGIPILEVVGGTALIGAGIAFAPELAAGAKAAGKVIAKDVGKVGKGIETGIRTINELPLPLPQSKDNGTPIMEGDTPGQQITPVQTTEQPIPKVSSSIGVVAIGALLLILVLRGNK